MIIDQLRSKKHIVFISSAFILRHIVACINKIVLLSSARLVCVQVVCMLNSQHNAHANSFKCCLTQNPLW